MKKRAGVAEPGQTLNGADGGLDARDSRSRAVGLRGFKSHPLHHRTNRKNPIER